MVRPLDTSPDAQQRQRAAFRAMTPSERLWLADAMSSEVRALAAAGIRGRQPGASDAEHAKALAGILLDAEVSTGPRGTPGTRR